MNKREIEVCIKEMLDESGIQSATIIAFALLQRDAEIATKGKGIEEEVAYLRAQVQRINEFFREEEFELLNPKS